MINKIIEEETEDECKPYKSFLRQSKFLKRGGMDLIRKVEAINKTVKKYMSRLLNQTRRVQLRCIRMVLKSKQKFYREARVLLLHFDTFYTGAHLTNCYPVNP